jgi:hypothetical protein
MSRTQDASQTHPAEAAATDDRGRRWFHLRPNPRRRTDLGGVNSTWWMVVGWIVLLVLVFFPFPGWW